MSAISKTMSRSSGIPCLVLAETSATVVSPPQSSGIKPASARLCLARFASASGLSILFKATTILACASLANLIASTV